LQGLQQLLASVVGPVWQRQVCAIEQECLLSGRPRTWEYLKVEFLRLTGHVAAHTARTVVTQLLDPVRRSSAAPLLSMVAVLLLQHGQQQKLLCMLVTAAQQSCCAVELRWRLLVLTHTRWSFLACAAVRA
jgi:hypothetical protein